MQGILHLDVCSSGLRVGMLRLFGPFIRNFFVPWEAIHVIRKERFWWKVAVLELGSCGKLVLESVIADRIAKSVPAQWPELGTIRQATKKEIAVGAFKSWLLGTVFVASFFTIVPRLMVPQASAVPILVTIGLPAALFGLNALFSYFTRVRHLSQ